MTESEETSSEWSALQARIREQERELLRQRDQIIGLEAQLAQLAEGCLYDALRSQVSKIESSSSYRVGRAVTAPARFMRRALNYLRRKTSVALRRSRDRLHRR